MEKKMVKLVKTESAEWQGNGFGSETAEWVVKGQENIAIRKLSSFWFAVNTSEYALINGAKVVKKIARANTKKELLEILSEKLA